MTKAKLLPRQRLFIKEYLKDFNATQAYIRAGYKAKNADVAAYQLLENIQITNEIKRLLKITELDTLTELTWLTHSDPRKLFRPDGSLKEPKEWDDATAHAVASLEVEDIYEGTGKDRKWIGRLKKIKFWDKSRNLENKLKHLRLLVDRVEFPDEEGKPQKLTDETLNLKLRLLIAQITGRPMVGSKAGPAELPEKAEGDGG